MLKLASLPKATNAAALILRLCDKGLTEAFMSPAMFDEYADVVAGELEILAVVQSRFETCYPLGELKVISHEPDNRFVECALACDADYLITVNTARGHFDQPGYGRTQVVTPGRILNLDAVQPLLAKLEE